jgi:hypothetical protein
MRRNKSEEKHLQILPAERARKIVKKREKETFVTFSLSQSDESKTRLKTEEKNRREIFNI